MNLSEMPVRFSGIAAWLSIIGPIGVLQKQMGVHYISLNVDGQEATRFVFTLLPEPQSSSSEQTEGRGE